jgi:NAD-dependent SIR2 family protein deacetylase
MEYFRAHSECLVPKCEECGAPMKPHCMFFDEAYSEHYYRNDTVKEFAKECDCLLVIGTALETGMAANIVRSNLQKDNVPVIEVCYPESNIGKGFNIQVLEKAEIALP